MRIIRVKDYQQMSRAAANIISAQVILEPKSVLGLATGSSPIGAYQQLIEWYKKGDVDFSQVTTVNLDEYVGLTPDHDQSYHYFMHRNFFDSVNIDPQRINIPDGCAPDMAAECLRYDGVLRGLGVDLQLLGLGNNGHIGFNEPGPVFSKGTHIVTLTDSTREANKRFFASLEDVPKTAVSMGTFDIMQAKRVLMVASGKAKAEAVKAAFFGPITPQMPASILQFHRDFTLVADEDALSLL
ncbi:MAG: glucosamine-6-phosphate deaminase [Oscillospiraceae bacterium]|nr:glucosamine-6-phosphate deaminase [Oscillospiraceae bacterium]